ncbi:hypothetical protein [Photobacterium damselae]|uniref:hypothetical protein n=1 Tax=Photobacterium damselae TaxID=38293 RepID=UPI001F35D604|nr:hypothetical protein [Photobacterium damselae]UKA12808.1 hypothetical protein IHC91_21180 [Photobacterium damselae subsp. damselae]
MVDASSQTESSKPEKDATSPQTETSKPEKVWVFRRLTQSSSNSSSAPDVVGLIAYSLYKAKKDERATNLRKQGKSGDEIQQKLNEYHELIASSDTDIQDLRDKALSMLEKAIEAPYHSLERKLNKKYDAEINNYRKQEEKAQKEHAVQRRKELKKLHDAIDSYTVRPWWVSCIKWSISGFPGVIATIITGVLIYGCFVVFGPEKTRHDVQKQVLSWALDATTTVSMPKAPQAVSNAVITPQKTASVTK